MERINILKKKFTIKNSNIEIFKIFKKKKQKAQNIVYLSQNFQHFPKISWCSKFLG